MSEQDNAATPGSQPATPVAEAPAQTPPVAETPATPAQSQQGETVSLTKEEHEQLLKDAARASEAQSRADRFEKALKRAGGKDKPRFGGESKSNPADSAEDKEAAGIEEDRKAEKGLMAIAIDPRFRPVFDNDRTLRELLASNPLGVLPLLAPDAVDAADAIDLITDALEARLEELNKVSDNAKPTPPATEPKPAATTVTPPPGGVNAPGATTPNTAYENAQKDPSTERGIAGMIKAKLAGGGS